MKYKLPYIRAGIRAFPGMLIEDSWIHRTADVDFSANAPTALVVGSALEFQGDSRALAEREELNEFCTELGTMIAKEGFHLVNGACPGLPDLVMSAFNEAGRQTMSVGLSAYSSPSFHTGPKEFAPDGFPLRADTTVFCGTGFELLNVLNTLCADVLIVVGGGVGTLLEAATAVEQELTVLCLEPSGGMSREIRELLGRYVADFKTFDVRQCGNVSEIQENLRHFRTAFTEARKKTRLAPLIEDIYLAERAAETQVQYHIADDTRSIEYSYRDVSIRLHDPVLMTDRVRISRIPDKGEQLLAAIEGRQQSYRFRGIEIITSRLTKESIWGPNIDTLLMLRALYELLEKTPFTKALEVGFGSGLISLWLAYENSLATVDALDIDQASFLAAEWNCHKLGLQERCRFKATSFEEAVLEKYDLVVCNPPYLPVPNHVPSTTTAFSGCSLLNNLLDSFSEITSENGILLFTASSTTFLDGNFRDQWRKLGERGKIEQLSCTRVPLKVHDILDDPEWLDYLGSGGGVFKRVDDDYSWWHDVSVYKICQS